MEATMQLAADCLTRLITEDRAPSAEEKALLAKMTVILLMDIHSISTSLQKIADRG